MKYFLAIFFLFYSVISVAQSRNLNERIVDVAVCKMNTKVGNGVCWKFVHQVLQEAKATITTPLENADIKPGDIFYTLGFYQFKGTYDSTVIEGLDAHIAIVYKVLGNNKYMIINQNSLGKRKRSRVVISTLDLNENFNTVSRGFWFFRPEAGDIFTHDLTHIYKKLPVTKG